MIFMHLKLQFVLMPCVLRDKKIANSKAKKLMEGYNEIRKISKEEKKSIKVLSQGAALRFLLTRVFDYLNIVDDAVVKIKDPMEYLKRLEFHKNAKSFEDYLI